MLFSLEGISPVTFHFQRLGCTTRNSQLTPQGILTISWPEKWLQSSTCCTFSQVVQGLFFTSFGWILSVIYFSVWKPEAVESTILPTSFKSRNYRNLLLAMSSHKTFRIKWFLAKEQKQHCPISQWIQMKTGNKIGTAPIEDIGEESDWVCKNPCIWSAT